MPCIVTAQGQASAAVSPLVPVQLADAVDDCLVPLEVHMFRRATFMPPAARVASISKESVLGPIVQMILVRRVLRKPAAMKVQDMMLLIIGSGLDCCMLCRI